MLRARHLLLLGVGLLLAACQGPDEYFRGAGAGQAGSGPTGAAGAIVSGAAGSGPTGTAGSGPTGLAGSVATGTAGTSAAAGTGGGGAPGTAGTNGAAGTTGMAGRGGTTGTGGGAGGTTGAAGAAGRGMGGGSAGRGGTTGAGGAAGRGGGGTTGTAGRGGAGGSASCPTGGRLDCTTAGALQLTPDGQVADFTAGQWNATTSRFCDAHGLGGGLSAYAGTGSTAMAAVDTTAGNLKLNLMVAAGQYAGGRLNFDSCVNASTFNSVQFTASVTMGSLTNCAWQVQIQTQNERPTTATNPRGGTCNATTATCERYPAAALTAATMTATTYTTRFTAFDNPAGGTVATPTQITGLQWQVNSGNNGSGTCTVELRIDNIRFVTQ